MFGFDVDFDEAVEERCKPKEPLQECSGQDESHD